MTIKIPKTFMGVDGKEALERILSGTPNTPPADNQNSGNIVPNSDIIKNNPRNYIQVPQHNIVIATAETHKGLNIYDTLDKLKDENLGMPRVAQFMDHWNNLREAADNKRQLFYADGASVDLGVASDLWKYVSSGHRGGCWTWLDAYFQPSQNPAQAPSQSNKPLEMLTHLRVIRSGNNKSLVGISSPLEPYLHEDAYTNLNFTIQGLPIPSAKSADQSYKQGQNIRFFQPIEGRVAGFYAGSDWAGLVCGRGPAVRGPRLGVFACAEGTAAPKN